MRNKILCYAMKYDGDWNKIASAIKNNEEVENVSTNQNYVTIVDEQYPEKLKALRHPPWILFYEGNLDLCNHKTVGIVGSRDICDYGQWVTEEICSKLPNDICVVSGLAKGIDGCAHRNSIHKTTIGIVGCGLDIPYPNCNAKLIDDMKKTQLVLTEYPNGVKPLKHHFPWRNRIIVALSDKLFVTQAKIKGGTMVTATLALEMGKEVFCVPYPIDDKEGEGCNQLILDGALILTSLDYLA